MDYKKQLGTICYDSNSDQLKLRQFAIWAGRRTQAFNNDSVSKKACLKFLDLNERYYFTDEVTAAEFNKKKEIFLNKYYYPVAAVIAAAAIAAVVAAHAAYWCNEASVKSGGTEIYRELYWKLFCIIKDLPDNEETQLLYG